MISLTCTKKSRAALAVSVALNVVIGPFTGHGAFAAVDQGSAIPSADENSSIDDLDTQMRNILAKPVDFCDPAAMEADGRAYFAVYAKKVELQRRAENIHPTIAQDVQKVVNTLADDGELAEESPIVENYEDAMRRGDKTAANALLAKMTPWDQSEAEEWSNNYPPVIKIVTAMADRGDVKAQRRLAGIYSWTTNFNMATIKATAPVPPRDDGLAFKYARLASANGDEPSQEILAKAYACGRGTKKDFIKAYAWFSLALSQSSLMLNTEDQPRVILRSRDFVAGEMSHDDIQRAKHLLIQCYKSKYKDCD